jgi:DNA-directed RNA polymerase specialized sigma24 family protein
VKRRLEKFGAGFRPKLEKAEAELDRLREQRDEQIRLAYRDGLPMIEIAEVLGVSRQTISRVIRD